MLAGAGYEDDPHVYVGSEGTRLVAEHAGIGMHIDVFFDKLEFCHTVPWKDRLELDPETIPLAELLLQKMQIVEINEKDLIDTITLFLEFPLGDHDDETINIDRVARVCAKDWGWWRTLTMNLDKVRQMAKHYKQLSDDETRRWPTRSKPRSINRGRAEVDVVEATGEGRGPQEVVPRCG